MPVYETLARLDRRLLVHYPAGAGHIVLRTELDWQHDVEPTTLSDDGLTSTFELEARRPFLYFKPLLRTRDGERWAVGPNLLLLMTADAPADVYPCFEGAHAGTLSDVLELESRILGRTHLARVYLPPGYRENVLRRYPVVYMQDGKNLFFPDEAFLGRDWKVDRALSLLDGMNAIDHAVVVGVHSGDRMAEYTQPGYEAYARSIVEEVKPAIDAKVRTLTSPRETAVMGSSLGGVVSFYMAWEYPQVFGLGACMSGTFAHRNDLIDRVLSESKRENRYYLDSGWPGDNYEVTLAMAMALVSRGIQARRDFLHLMFPLEEHDETAWGRRLHLPLQLGLSKITAAERGRHL
jgi:predicted alpha/beta superfamily hydrolase